MKEEFFKKGYVFRSDIDIEVIVYFIEEELKGFENFEEVFRKVLNKFRGFFVFVIVYVDEFDKFYVVRNESLFVLGIGEGEMFVVSDVFVFFEYIIRLFFWMMGSM